MLVLVLIKPSKLCSIGLKSRKQRAASEDHEVQETDLHLNQSSHNNSGKDLGSHCSEESSPLEEPVLETPLAKRIRADDYIEIIDSDCDVAAEDEPVTINSPADIATSQDDISPSTETAVVLSNSINSSFPVLSQSGIKESQMENPPENNM